MYKPVKLGDEPVLGGGPGGDDVRALEAEDVLVREEGLAVERGPGEKVVPRLSEISFLLLRTASALRGLPLSTGLFKRIWSKVAVKHRIVIV